MKCSALQELRDLYCTPYIVQVIKSRRMKWAGHVARMGDKRGAYRVLMGNTEGKRPLGRPRRRWEDDIKMDIQELGSGAWTGLVWLSRGTGGSSCNAVMNLPVPYNAGNFLTNLKPVSFSRSTLLHGVSE
jgi:hypothetical protein